MEYQGICHKMRTSIQPDAQQPSTQDVLYRMVLGGIECPVSTLVGQPIELVWTGQIFCVGCGKKTPKSYSQGYCFKCFKTRAATDLCMLKPETCHFHLGTCREPQWGEQVCFQPHIVYLANSSGIKVGITRYTQLPTRWLDQGASQAIPVMQVASRFLSGVVESLFATELADKTDWRTLLKGAPVTQDMAALRTHLIEQYTPRLEQLAHAYPDSLQFLTTEAQQFRYPVQRYPAKINTHNLDKAPTVRGTLQGIKGQYWLLDTGVINIRKYTGYELILRAEGALPDVVISSEQAEAVQDVLADV